MNAMRWLRWPLVTALAVTGCDANSDPASPSDVVAPPSYEVVDGVRNGGAPGFFFLPPLATYVAPQGAFDARRAPVVEVCELKGTACKGDLLARFTTSDAPRDQAVRAYPFDTREGVRGFYLVFWKTRDVRPVLKAGRVFRARVVVDDVELGHADVVIATTALQWLRYWLTWARDPSVQPAPHLRDLPLPIAFRIDQGAVPTPPAPPWPDEPAGLTVMTDQPWDAVASLGWRHLDRMATSGIVSDPTAPLSPSNVLEHVFPVGYTGGVAPAVDYYSLYRLPEARELFVGAWFKVDDPWQGAVSGFNVLEYVALDGGGRIAVPMYGPVSGPLEIRVLEGWSGGGFLSPNVGPAQVTPGVWHRLELHLRYSSAPGVPDGVVRWWLDGALAGDYANRSYPAGTGFLEYQLAPNWGGVGDVKTQSDYLRVDHTFISGG